MICWDCYWGWPKIVADIYFDALNKLDGNKSPLHFGPAHVVWEDENFDSAEWCLENFEKYTFDYRDYELRIVKESLEKLASVPIEERCLTPDDYDGWHPELYPPPDGAEMVRI